MGRSSRILCYLCLFAATPALGQGRPLMVRMPTNGGPRMIMHMTQPAARPNLMVRRAGRVGLGVRRGGFAFDGVGLGLSLASDLATPQLSGPYGSAPQPEVVAGVSAPPCIRPQIIKIGLGLRHVARTRVIYGTPSACVP